MEEYKEWFGKARKDLKAAKYNQKGKLYDIAAFLCQQAIEKALKSLSIKKFKKIKKIHDLVALGKEVNLPDRYIDCCKEITAAYIYTRYPEMPKIDNIEKSSKDYIKKAEEILKWIKEHS